MTYPWPTDPPSPAHRAAYADAVARPFWLDALPQRDMHAPLTETIEADLCIVGGGYTGLWAALYAKELDPARDVVVLEATRCGNGASGRNGGFLQSSLTHGIGNGLARFPVRWSASSGSGSRTSTRSPATSSGLGIDAEYEAHRRSAGRARAARGATSSKPTPSWRAASGMGQTCSTASRRERK